MNTIHPKENEELHLAMKGISFLAVITALIYLRVAIGNLLSENPIIDGAWLMLLLLIVALAGLLISWRWSGWGGFLTLLAGLGLTVLAYSTATTNPIFVAFLYGSPFIVSGAFALACWRK